MASRLKLLSVIAVLVMVASVIPMVPIDTASADEDQFDIVDQKNNQGYKYTDSTKTDVHYAGYAGEGKPSADLDIPGVVKSSDGVEHKVTGINSYSVLPEVETINIGKNVSTLDMPFLTLYSPEESSKLRKITVDNENASYIVDENGMLLMKISTETVRVIVMCPPAKTFEDGVFDASSYYMLYQYSLFCCHNIKEIILPKDVNVIKKGVFCNCINLEKVHIKNSESFPSSVVIIDSEAFSNCYNLKNVILGDDITTIGDRAFYNCKALETIHFGNSMSNISSNAFLYCSSLKNISVGESCSKYIVPNEGEKYAGILMKRTSMSYNFNSIALYPGGMDKDTLTLDNDIAGIEPYAFAIGQGKLKTINYNVSGPDIDDAAFAYCESLETFNMNSNISLIGDMSFLMCSRLTTFTGSGSVISINSSAFAACTSLKSITFTEKLKEIGDYSFSNSGIEKFTIPSSVTNVGEGAFAYSDLKEVTIEGKPTIGLEAFETYGDLTIYKLYDFAIPDNAYSENTNVTIVNTDEWHFPWYNVVGIIICLLILAGMVYLFRKI